MRPHPAIAASLHYGDISQVHQRVCRGTARLLEYSSAALGQRVQPGERKCSRGEIMDVRPETELLLLAADSSADFL